VLRASRQGARARGAGRKVAVIADAGSDLAGIAALTKTLNKLGTEVLVTAAVGATLKAGRRSLVVERTFATARSIEFDAVVIAAGTTVTNDIELSSCSKKRSDTVSRWEHGVVASSCSTWPRWTKLLACFLAARSTRRSDRTSSWPSACTGYGNAPIS
jgi:hypothetical protein